MAYSYNTRNASKLSYYLPKVRTNYGKFNIRFQGPMIWNSIDEDFKSSSLSLFKLVIPIDRVPTSDQRVFDKSNMETVLRF